MRAVQRRLRIAAAADPLPAQGLGAGVMHACTLGRKKRSAAKEVRFRVVPAHAYTMHRTYSSIESRQCQSLGTALKHACRCRAPSQGSRGPETPSLSTDELGQDRPLVPNSSEVDSF